MFINKRMIIRNIKNGLPTHLPVGYFFGGVGDANPSIFSFFEVLQMAWDHAHSTQLVLLILLVGSRVLYDPKKTPK